MRPAVRSADSARYEAEISEIFECRFGTRYLRSRKLRCMVTSVTPVLELEQHMPRAQAHAGGEDAHVRFDFGAYLDSPTSTISFARQTPDQSHVEDRNRAGEYCCNQQYSVTAITTSTGAISERYAYSAYGQPTILDASGSILSTSSISNRYTYTGREWDATLGLHHFRARWMSPSAGRFLSRDPLGFDGGWSHYSFVNGRALIELDPTGMIPGGDNAFLADCRRILYATIAGWRLTGFNCSADLLASWLRKKPDPCPSSCLVTLNSNGFGFVNDGCLKSRMAFLSKCPGSTTESFQALGSHIFEPSSLFGRPGSGDDMAFSFHEVRWSASGTCVATCAAKAGSCCCSCSGSCGYDLTIGPDKYDFEKGKTSYPHPLYCAWYVQEYGGLKNFEATCKKTVYAQPISFDRCPGPPLPWTTPCAQTKQSGNTTVIE
jgi:RHS repeat-associated protein